MTGVQSWHLDCERNEEAGERQDRGRRPEHVVTAGMATRAVEAADLLSWVPSQPPAPDLLDRTVLRWVDSVSVDKLRGISVNANPVLMRTIATNSGRGIRDNLSAVVNLLAGDADDPVRTLLIRMALLSINAADGAAAGTSLTDGEIVATARRASLAILTTLSIEDQAAARPVKRCPMLSSARMSERRSRCC